LARYQEPTTSYSTVITLTIKNFQTYYFSFSYPNPTHLLKHEFLSPNNKFYQRIWYVEYYSVHAYQSWPE